MMAGPVQSHEVGIVLYPGAQLAAVHGLTDLFRIASDFSAGMGKGGPPPLRVSHWRQDGDDISCVYSSAPATSHRPAILILPPTLTDLPDDDSLAKIGHWLLRRHRQGAALVSICSGIFLLAGTGLLDGLVVATHPSCVHALRTSCPTVTVDTDNQMIEHPDILTAGGFMAWVEVALILIERLLGDEVREETARFVLYGNPLQPARTPPALAPRHAHGDVAVRKAQELVHMRDGRGVSLAAMVAAARLERRTFLRRFAYATRMTPIEYCRAVRIARARELLEAGTTPLKTIADVLGYGDVSSFARAFRRAHGLPPGTYRQRHGGLRLS